MYLKSDRIAPLIVGAFLGGFYTILSLALGLSFAVSLVIHPLIHMGVLANFEWAGVGWFDDFGWIILTVMGTITGAIWGYYRHEIQSSY